MAELLIHVGNSECHSDGDVLCAFTDRRIQIVHQQHIASLRRFGRDGLRPNDWRRDWWSACYQYEFRRVSRTHISRIETDTLGRIKSVDYFGPESIDVDLYLRRRLAHHGHRIFGRPGREVWHGGQLDFSMDMVQRGWEIIESRTPVSRGWCNVRRQNHSLWPYGTEELKQFLAVRVNFLAEDIAEQLIGNKVDWRQFPFSERRVLDPQELIGNVHLSHRCKPVVESLPVTVGVAA